MSPELSKGATVGLSGPVEMLLHTPGITLLSTVPCVPAMSSPPAYPGRRQVSGRPVVPRGCSEATAFAVSWPLAAPCSVCPIDAGKQAG